MRTKAGKSKNTNVCVGGRIIMEKRRAVTFFIKTLADDQRKRSYCWKARSPCTHTHTPSSIHPHTPPFQTSWESCIPLSHLLSKVTIKDAKCVRVQVCMSLYVSVCVAASEKNLIGKLYLRAPRDCAATVNDLSEKGIPECTWGLLPWGDYWMTSESGTPGNLPARQQINFPQLWRGWPCRRPYLHCWLHTLCQIQNRGRLSEGRKVTSLGRDDNGVVLDLSVHFYWWNPSMATVFVLYI